MGRPRFASNPLAGQAWQGTHPAGGADYYEAKPDGMAAISPNGGTAAVNRENNPKNRRAKAVRTFAPFADAAGAGRHRVVA